MLISKKDMASRVAKAAEAAPGIEDRLRQAREMVHTHPIDETSHRRLEPSLTRQAEQESALLPAGPRLQEVPLDDIDQNPFNARKIYRTERVSELAASIGAHGQEIPGIATIRAGRFVLVAGHYRLRALKVLGAKTMLLMIHLDLSDKELYSHSYRENAERESQSALDNALSWRQLIDQGVYKSETDIADATGMSLPNVNKTLAALRLTGPVLDVVKEAPNSFALSLLYELSLYEAVAGQGKALAMARQIGQGELSRREITAARTQLETPKERKRKETSRQYKLQRDGQPIGYLKEWDSGKVTFEIKFSDAAERENLVEELRTRYGQSGEAIP